MMTRVWIFAAILALSTPWAHVAGAQSGAETTPQVQQEPAQSPDTPEATRRYLDDHAFEKLFGNRSVHLTLNGEYYGSEHYYPGKKTVWAFRDGPCTPGVWTFQKRTFCFSYPNQAPSCWRVFEEGGDYFAESIEGLLLRIDSVTSEPLDCGVPEVS